ncbi:MarR family transcriptional regulator [Planomonospora alba]
MRQATRGTAHADVAGIVHFVNLIAASGRSPRTARRLQTVVATDVTITDTRALVWLMPDRKITVGQVAAALEVDLSRASRQLGRLEEMGLILRAVDPGDRRTHWITITDAGRALLRTWWAVWINDYLVALDGWATGDVVRLGELIERLHRAVARDAAGPVIDIPADCVARALGPEADRPRRAALERFAPVVAAFVEWTGLTTDPVANTQRLAQLARCPVAMRSLIALRTVARHGPLAVSELGERLGMDSSRASKHAAELADKGLLMRAVDTLDRRSSRLRATRKGTELIRRIDTLQRQKVREATAHWPHEEIAACSSLLERYADDLASGHVDVRGWAVPWEQTDKADVPASRERAATR